MRTGLKYLLSAAVVALAGTGWGQNEASNWRKFKIADGLPEATCTSVTISPHGQVLVTHLNSPGISRLNGYDLELIPVPETGQPRRRVYESSGGQLWTVVTNGLLELRSQGWSLYTNLPEVTLLCQSYVARPYDPVPLCPVRQGYVMILFPDRLAGLECDDPARSRLRLVRDSAVGQVGRFSSMVVARDGGLWVAGARGLAKAPGPIRTLSPQSEWREYLPPASLQLQNFQDPHEDRNGDVTMVAELGPGRQRVVAHFDGWEWTTNAAGTDRIRFGWMGFEGACWAATTNSLFQREEGGGEMVENDEISARIYYDLAIETSGAFWLATSDGLFRYSPLAWRSPHSLGKFNASIACLAGDSEGRLWFVTGMVLHSLRNERHEEFLIPARVGRRPVAARSLFPLRNGTILIEAANQLLKFQPGSGTFTNLTSRERGERFRVLGTLKDRRVCVQRFAADLGPDPHLELFDGDRFEPLPEAAPTGCGAEFSALCATQNGDLWLSGDRATALWHAGRWRVFTSTDRSTPVGAVGFAEAPDGRIWCATTDSVWEFDGHNWLTARSGFDRISGLMRTPDGSLWVGANSGLYRWVVSQGAWVENGREEGLFSASIRGLCEDQAGRLWAGTARGLDFFDPNVDRDPPQTRIRIHELTETGRSIPEGGTITLRFIGHDKWNYTPPARLLYSYQLDDHEWTPFSERDGVSFSDQPSGTHILRVRAMDRCGNVEPKPASYEFEVILPWYRETRLVAISAAGLAGALFFAGLAFNRHLRLVRSYAEVEKKVADRTRELELANRELLHSQKMTALGTLAAGIAHDFNNILSIIQGSAQIIEENLDNQAKVRTRVQRIKTVVEQGSSTVKAMLGFSRDSGPRPEPCNLNTVVGDTVKLLGDRFLREVQVDLDLAPHLPEVVASKDLIQQILLNFLFNAAESMTGRRQVTLASRQLDHLPDTLVLAPAKAATYVAVSVRDSGCGIPSEIMARIFEPFFTTKAMSARRGTGLGLSMVYEFAKKIGAGLAVESVVDQGSTFTVILPVKTAEVPATP